MTFASPRFREELLEIAGARRAENAQASGLETG